MSDTSCTSCTYCLAPSVREQPFCGRIVCFAKWFVEQPAAASTDTIDDPFDLYGSDDLKFEETTE